MTLKHSFWVTLLVLLVISTCQAVSMRLHSQATVVMSDMPAVPIPPGQVFSNGTILYNSKYLSDTNSEEYKVAKNATECADVKCQNGGSCSYGTCACATGFSGTRCEINACTGVFCPFGQACTQGTCVASACASVVCHNDGACNPASGTCECKNGFTGLFCTIDPCSLIKCLNGGICTYPGTCQCRDHYFGDRCEKDSCTEGGIVCQNSGRCAHGKCYCTKEWEGEHCDIPSDAARDHYKFNRAIEASSDTLKNVYDKFVVIANATDPRRIASGFRMAFEDYEKNMLRQAEEDSKKDFMTPRVIGYKPVYNQDMAVPKTPYENAKIYEDQQIAYHIGHEVRYRPLIEARDLVNRTLQQRQVDSFVIAKDVPGAEYVNSPFGRFAEMNDKYMPQDTSLLDQDINTYRSEKAELAQSILDAEDLMI